MTSQSVSTDPSPVAPREGRLIDEVKWQLRLRIWLRRQIRALKSAATLEVEKEQEPIRRNVAARVVLGLLIAGYIGFFTYWTVRQHYGFATFGFDLGIFEQGMWLVSRGKEPFVTVLGLNLFGDHSSFLLVLLVPFYWLFSGTATLLVGQAVALGAGAWPAFLLAREKLRSEVLAVGIALAYLLHPSIGLTNLENFHPDTFEVPLLLGALYFMTRRRWMPYAICVGAILLIKEDVPLLTFALGIYVAIRYDRRVGILTSLVSVLWFATILLVIFPQLNGVGTLDAWRLPSNAFGGIGGLFKAVFTRPWEIIEIALGPERPWYLWQMFAPVAFLSLLAPGLLLVAIGPMMSNLLSTFWYQYQIGYHYGTLIVPILIASTVFGIARFSSQRIRRVLVSVVVVAAMICGFMWGPVGRRDIVMADPGSELSQSIRDAIDVIPEDAPVSAVYYAVPHLAHREHIYEFPVPWHARNWGDFSQEGERLSQADLIEYVLVPEVMEPELQRVFDRLPKEGFREVHDSGGMVVLERRDP